MKIIKLLFISLLIQVFSVTAQENYKMAALESGANFFEIVKTQREYFEKLKESGIWTRKEAKAYKQFERWAYIWKDRINPDGTFPSKEQGLPAKELADFLLKKNNMRAPSSLSASSWELVGPFVNVNENDYDAYPGMGRINVVAIDPTDEEIMYAGAAAGGIWKTTDGGNNWTPVGDQFAGMGVSDIIIDPVNPDTVYVATGDCDGWQIYSIGVYKSTDGGNTWNPTGLIYNLNDGELIWDLAFYPGNSQKIFALTKYHILVSNDGGNTWQIATNNHTKATPYFQTIVFDPDNPSKVVVSDVWGGLSVSEDGGNSFDLHDAFTPGNSLLFYKLATSEADTNYFYGMDANGNFMKFRFEMDYTNNDKVKNTEIDDFNSQGGYNIALAVSPTDKNNIIVGGVRGYTSDDNGDSFKIKLDPYDEKLDLLGNFYVHPDHHHMSFLSNGTTVINGHDGGVHKGEFTANSWTDISNGLIITQSYNIAVTQTQNGDDFMMANQDNDGFSKVLKDGERQWVAAASGDGTAAGIDYNNPDIRYLGGTSGALYRTEDGYSSGAFSETSILSSTSFAAFVSPMEIHPTNPATIYAAHGDILKSTNRGDDWESLNSGISPITYINLSPYNNTIQICVVDRNGNAKHSVNDGGSWESLSKPSGLLFNSVVAKPNAETLYATVTGYTDGSKVFKSTDGGNSWENISDGLPNVAMKRIVLKTDEDNETLFVGTELGVYWKNNTMSSWEKLGDNLPNVIVNDLRINYADQDLYIGTFGRSMWKINVSNLQQIEFTENEKPIVYPNPVSDGNLFVKITPNLLNTGHLQYKLYNVIGGIVSEGKINNITTNLKVKQVAPGLYMLKIYNETQALIKKLIIK